MKKPFRRVPQPSRLSPRRTAPASAEKPIPEVPITKDLPVNKPTAPPSAETPMKPPTNPPSKK